MINMNSSRRKFLRNSLLATAGLTFSSKLMASTSLPAPIITNPTLPSSKGFEQKELGYGFSDLEPYIDTITMETHYGKHHAGYVRKLNAAIEQEPKLSGKSLEDLLMGVSRLPDSVKKAVRNNGGGHWNHTFYWQVMSPDANGTKPSDELRMAMMETFNDMESFQEAFKKEALGVFGSGWAWLIKDKDGKLKLTGTPNQDNPLMDVTEERGMPILGIDVWEHAYYLKNKNMRGSYVDSFMKTINWEFVSKMYAS